MIEKDSLKSIIAFSLEVVLMRIGGPKYPVFVVRLESDHGMKMHDCFDNPKGLKMTLQIVYDEMYPFIIENLEAELGELASKPEVIEFLNALRE